MALRGARPAPSQTGPGLVAQQQQASVAREAEAVIGEVAMLEGLLRDAAIANQGRLQQQQQLQHAAWMPSERAATRPAAGISCSGADDAMTAYGAQLRAWVELQVDARFNHLLSGTVEPELMAARSASAAALASTERLEEQLGAACEQQTFVTDGQSKLLTLVEGISEETERIKAAVTACQAAVVQVQAQATAATEAAAAATAVSGSSSNDAAAAGTQALQCVERAITTAGAVEARLERHESELKEVLQMVSRSDQRLQSLAASRDIQDAQFRELTARRQLSEDEELELRDKFAKLLETRFAAWRGDLASEIAEDIRTAGRVGAEQAHEQFARTLRAMRTDEAAHAARVECEEVRKEVRLCEATLRQEVAASRQALTAELATAMRSEAAAVAALDEQLWLTDQRLGQRIDELARAHCESQFKASAAPQPAARREPFVPQSTFRLSQEVGTPRLGSPR